MTIRESGMDPDDIWKELDDTVIDSTLIPAIINKLIHNNINRNYIKFDENTNRVILTSDGYSWALSNYFRFV